jgi:hypothetical protein
MIILSFASLFQFLDWSSLVWGSLWGGLVALTLGLSFMLWTRWGEYHLTAKCVIFSVLAHTMLGLLFATAEVVEDVVVALNQEEQHEPITIEHVKVAKQIEDVRAESNVDGRSDESGISIWDRAQTEVSIESAELSRPSVPIPQSAVPERTPGPG